MKNNYSCDCLPKYKVLSSIVRRVVKMIKYDEIIEILKMPKIVIPYLNIIYNDDDFKIIEAIKDKILTISDIERLLGRKADYILNSAYKNSVVDKVLDNGKMKYKISSLEARLDNLASFQKEKWAKIEEQDRKKISDWLFKVYLDKKKSMPIKNLIHNASKIVPLNIAIDFVKSTSNDIYLIPCDCKSITEKCSFDKNVCMSMGSGLNTSSDRGHGKKLDKDEAVELLRHADREGLIHTLEENAICNCCTCCCYPLRASQEMGLKGKWPYVSYMIKFDSKKCVGCGVCERRCPQKVFKKQGKTIELDTLRCVGCGICVGSCPKKALHLENLQ